MSNGSERMDEHADAWVPAGSLRAADLGKWIMTKGLDRPKQILRVTHNEGRTSVQWFRDPEKQDAVSGMVTPPDCMVNLYRTKP